MLPSAFWGRLVVIFRMLSKFADFIHYLVSSTQTVSHEITSHDSSRPAPTAPTVEVHRPTPFNVLVNTIQYLYHLPVIRDPSIFYWNPLKSNLKAHRIRDGLYRTLIGDKRLHVSVEFARLHEIDHVTDSVVKESSELSFSFLHIFRTRIATSHELTWQNPVRTGKRDVVGITNTGNRKI